MPPETLYSGPAYQRTESFPDHSFPAEPLTLPLDNVAGGQLSAGWAEQQRWPPGSTMPSSSSEALSVGKSGFSGAREHSVRTPRPNSSRVHKPYNRASQSVHISPNVLLSMNDYNNPDASQYWPQPVPQQGAGLVPNGSINISSAAQAYPALQTVYGPPSFRVRLGDSPWAASPASHASYSASQHVSGE
jgi:hypothetical protein